MKPLIGVSPTPELIQMEHGVFRRHTLSDNYSMAIEAAGGVPVMLPAHQSDIGAILDHLDGVVISGGGDIAPQLYEREAYPKTAGVDAERDTFEVALINETIARDMPLLGICRGLQMLNVALGGTLVQDIADLKEKAQHHRQQDLGIADIETSQDVDLAPSPNLLRDIVGTDRIAVNSFHHQGIDQLAESLEAIASTDDGLIEAAVLPTATFGLAVQWHPEMLAPTMAEHAAIFSALVNAASDYRSRSKETQES